MNAQKKLPTKVKVLGKCPSCGLPLYEDNYGFIVLKGQDLKLLDNLGEDLIVCKGCLDNPENLSVSKVEETLRTSKVKWEEDDIRLAVSAVEAYKNAKLDHLKNSQKDPMEGSKN